MLSKWQRATADSENIKLNLKRVSVSQLQRHKRGIEKLFQAGIGERKLSQSFHTCSKVHCDLESYQQQTFFFFFLLNLTVQWASQAESHWTGSERRKRTAKRRRELHVCDNLPAWGSWLTCRPNEIHQGQKNKTLKMKTDAETFFNVIELPPPDGTPPVSLSEWRSFFLNSRRKTEALSLACFTSQSENISMHIVISRSSCGGQEAKPFILSG